MAAATASIAQRVIALNTAAICESTTCHAMTHSIGYLVTVVSVGYSAALTSSILRTTRKKLRSMYQ
jgi:hypothetical protein